MHSLLSSRCSSRSLSRVLAIAHIRRCMDSLLRSRCSALSLWRVLAIARIRRRTHSLSHALFQGLGPDGRGLHQSLSPSHAHARPCFTWRYHGAHGLFLRRSSESFSCLNPNPFDVRTVGSFCTLLARPHQVRSASYLVVTFGGFALALPGCAAANAVIARPPSHVVIAAQVPPFSPPEECWKRHWSPRWHRPAWKSRQR